MPRAWSGNAFWLATQGPYARVNYYLEIDAPSGMITVSDSPRVGRQIVKSWGAIAPLLVEGDTVPEAQSFDVVLSNTPVDDARIADDLNEIGIEGVECRLYAMDVGPYDNSTIKLQLVFEGRFQQLVSATASEVVIRIDGRGAYFARSLDHLVRDSYPQAPTAFASRLQPLLYGRVNPWPLIPVDVGVVGELESSLAAAATSCVIAEDVSRWPTSGTVQIEYERVTYSGKTDATRTLTGLTRGRDGTTDSAHPAAAVVIQVPTDGYKFLVADRQYGQVLEPASVSVAGKKLVASSWDFSAATNLVTIQPQGNKVGRPTYGQAQAQVRGLKAVMHRFVLNSTQTNPKDPSTPARLLSDNPQTRPIINAAHSAMCAWDAPSNDYFWDCGSNWDVATDEDKTAFTSSVKLEPNTPKTWSAAWFSTYLPPPAIFTRTGFSVGLIVVPALRVATPFEMKLRVNKLRKIICRVNGVERTWESSGDDVFAADTGTTFGSTTPSHSERIFQTQAQSIVFDFGTDVDPDTAPHAVTIEAVCDSGGSSYVARVQSLTQSIDGVLPWTSVSSCQQATLSTETTAQSVTLTFASAPTYAVLALAFRTSADIIKVDLGGGKVVRFTPPALEQQLSAQAQLISSQGQFMTATVVVQNPSTTITVSCHDFGNGGLPFEYAGTFKNSRILIGSATLTGFAAGSGSTALLPPEKKESAFLLLHDEYPTADAWGYSPDSVNITDRPYEVAEHYLTEVMGEDAVDVDVDEDSGSWASTYTLNGGITDQVDIRLPLVWIARDSRAWVWWDPVQGQWRMRYRDSPATIIAAAADHTWGPGNWLPGEPALVRMSDSTLITKVNLRWLRDWNLGRNLESYKAVAPSGSGTRTADERYASDFCRNSTMAADLAAFYAAWDTVATRRTSIVALIKHVDVERGDVVSLSLPVAGSDPVTYLQGVQSRKFIVLAVGLTLHDLGSGIPSSVPVLLLEVPT